MKSSGQVLYEAWAEVFDGDVAEWDALSTVKRDAWEQLGMRLEGLCDYEGQLAEVLRR